MEDPGKVDAFDGASSHHASSNSPQPPTTIWGKLNPLRPSNVQYDTPLERSIVRKFDLKILPILSLLYLFAYLDRTNLGNARLQNLPEDILGGDPTGVLFDWVNSAFFFSYILVQVPATILMKQFNPNIWIGCAAIGWSICSVLMSATFNFAGITVCRIGLGAFEAGFSPAIPLYFSFFYTKAELGVRLAWWFAFAAVAGAFGGLIAFAIQQVNLGGTFNNHNWKLLFIVEGIPAFILGVFILIYLPTRPETTAILQDGPERDLAIERTLRGTHTEKSPSTLREYGSQNENECNPAHIALAFLDWKVYTAGVIHFALNATLASISAFLPTIVETFGFSAADAQLLTVPPYACAAIVLSVLAFASDRLQSRVAENEHARYFAIFCITSGTYSHIGIILAWFLHNLGSESKKATGTALYIYYRFENKRRDRSYGQVDSDAKVDMSKLADDIETAQEMVGEAFILLFCGTKEKMKSVANHCRSFGQERVQAVFEMRTEKTRFQSKGTGRAVYVPEEIICWFSYNRLPVFTFGVFILFYLPTRPESTAIILKDGPERNLAIDRTLRGTHTGKLVHSIKVFAVSLTVQKGTLLKEGRYKIIRKLDQDHYSNIFLVEDLQSSEPGFKFLAAKILSADATKVNGTHEYKILLKVSEVDDYEPPLPVLCDYFTERGLHGEHYCFLSRPLSMDVDAFRASAPTRRLGVHIVKPIVACTVEALQRLHSLDIIHADIKASNLLFFDLGSHQIEGIIARDPTSYGNVYTFNGTEYPTLKTQPFQPALSWDATPYDAETIQVNLSGLGAALWAERPNSGNIGTFELRAPEIIIRSKYGKEIDIWAIGCMTYELLTGQTLFRPLVIPDHTPDESLLMLQFAVTGETLSKDVVDQSGVRDKIVDHEGILIHSKKNIYPPQSIKERLTILCKDDLTERQINEAAKFINDCLRLNPQDRPTADQLDLHPWLGTAFGGCGDNED
ncbi:hypothetical protein Clacol_009111 [Clathrus columnatus]|uniref:Protein kinase domain-containing protein n=1 Tax=Clathrus columnatus TaxID=1419009 RepID=A0AAV5AP62_9AGAM|nr:hypothetical protein Clacol_009111 [Clathrus columnatus]